MTKAKNALKDVAGFSAVGGLLGGQGPLDAIKGGGIGGNILKKQMKNLTEVEAAPEIAGAATMPTPNDAAIRAARQRRALQLQNRSGRQSTLLSAADTLG